MTVLGRRVAVVTTHPIQYYAPWFRWMTEHAAFDLKIFYLWEPEATTQRDPGFGHKVEWDLPLLDGYEHESVENTASLPGSDHFWGMQNPDLLRRLKSWKPEAALLIGYRYASMMRLIFTWSRYRGFPLLLKGDSHRLYQPQGGTWKVRFRKIAIGAVFRRFGACLYVGQANSDYFQLHGVSDERLFFSPHAVDNERFMSSAAETEAEASRWRTELGIPSESLLILFAGKFEEKKRPIDLLEAFARVKKVGSENAEVEGKISLLFVGAGKLEPELRARAESVSRVFFAPFQNQMAMPRTYAACDLFVLPSFGPEESWGLAVNEAMCLAKPVIVSSHVGCGQDLVRQGENGLVFEAGNLESLTEALREAISDRQRLRRWGQSGRAIVERYSYANATRGLEKALEFMATRGRRG